MTTDERKFFDAVSDAYVSCSDAYNVLRSVAENDKLDSGLTNPISVCCYVLSTLCDVLRSIYQACNPERETETPNIEGETECPTAEQN